jgi:predicted nucleic acid-binding protein
VRRFLPDTSVMIAASCSWHEHHSRAADALESRLVRGEAMVIAAPALVETYAVLTRLPAPHRLSPGDSIRLLEANFMPEARLVALDAKEYRSLLQKASESGVSGGKVYDAVIAACAVRAGVSALLTLNAKDFDSFATQGLEIVDPSSQ